MNYNESMESSPLTDPDYTLCILLRVLPSQIPLQPHGKPHKHHTPPHQRKMVYPFYPSHSTTWKPLLHSWITVLLVTDMERIHAKYARFPLFSVSPLSKHPFQQQTTHLPTNTTTLLNNPIPIVVIILDLLHPDPFNRTAEPLQFPTSK